MTETAYQKSFNRFEIKYLIRQEQAAQVRALLTPYTLPDPHGDPERGYPVNSLYCDSSGLRYFWEKIDGLKARRKLRFRRYGDQNDAFIEIKARTDRTTQKRRVRKSLDDLATLFRPGPIPDLLFDGPPDATASEAMFLWRAHCLRPTISIWYRRLALIGRFEPDLRITFDSHLQFNQHVLDVSQPWTGGSPLFDPRLVVLEVKFDHAAPGWVGRLISESGIAATRLSKYCRGVDLHRFGGTYT